MFDEFFAKAQELRQRGQPFATATVVRAEVPTSAKPGDKAIVTLDGVMYGWIGGSCAQPTVIAQARRAIADDRSRLIRLAADPATAAADGIEVQPMTCYSGGTLDVFIEPQQPQPRLLIVGHLPVAQALVHLGKAMSYRVIAIDHQGDGAALDHADEVLTDLAALAERVTPLCAVVIATHGNYDELAAAHALGTAAPYVGLIASRKRAAAVRRDLRQRGLEDADLERLRAPAGLDIGGRRGDEIALSVMTEIVQLRRRAERLAWTAHAAADPAPEEAAASPATDPVCGMSVNAGSRHRHTHDGVVHGFCCDGCRARFAADPARYLAAAAP